MYKSLLTCLPYQGVNKATVFAALKWLKTVTADLPQIIYWGQITVFDLKDFLNVRHLTFGNPQVELITLILTACVC